MSGRDGDPYAPPEGELFQPAESGKAEFSWDQVCGALVVFALAVNLLVAGALVLGRLLW